MAHAAKISAYIVRNKRLENSISQIELRVEKMAPLVEKSSLLNFE
jgi:hypothetical protein